jgi:two-component system NtrC family sensor kinase
MGQNRLSSSVNGSVELREYWALSNQIIELASKGYPRPQYLKDVTRLILTITGSDVIDLVFRDGGRQFMCRAGLDGDPPYRFEQISPTGSGNETLNWSTGGGEAVEKLCSDIINKNFDHSQPCFTRNGSFWTGDINNVSVFGPVKTETDTRLGIDVNKDCRSVVIIPIDIRHERVGLLELRSKRTDFFDEYRVGLFEQMGRTIGIALTHRRIHIAIRERVKELTCLYGIAKLVQRPNITLDYILQEAVKLLPPAWLYPEIASAQIVFGDQVYISPDFKKAVHRMQADIIVDEKKLGYVEIRYCEERLPLDDGPFLREERSLIDTIAQELAIIIEQFQAEEKNANLQEQLRHADRLATIGQLVAGVAHELNEPLANVLGFAQLAVKTPDLPAQVKNDLEKIIVSALHARDVIQKLLTSAKGTPSARVRFNINDLITEGLSFLRSRCVKSGIELICNLAEDIPDMTADRSQIIQVLTNLAVNAIQAMPHGGRLIITTRLEQDHIILTTEDTGIGMEERVVDRIFDPFFTTKDSDQGTGLGLPIVQNIITSHGGTIDVESEPGSGTRFTVRLPLESPERT